MTKYTKGAFESQHAADLGITVEQLRLLGRIIAPCICTDSQCPGWQSLAPESVQVAKELGRLSKDWQP